MTDTKPIPTADPVPPVPPPATRRWKFSHNNCPEILIDAPANAAEAEVVRLGLHRIGLAESTHPCRAWPA